MPSFGGTPMRLSQTSEVGAQVARTLVSGYVAVPRDHVSRHFDGGDERLMVHA